MLVLEESTVPLYHAFAYTLAFSVSNFQDAVIDGPAIFGAPFCTYIQTDAGRHTHVHFSRSAALSSCYVLF